MRSRSRSSSSSSSSRRASGDYRLDNLPAGYRFKPSDGEIIRYLHHKINHGVSLMPNIRDVHLYDSHPQFLTEKYPPLGDDEWYFFTPRNRKYPNGMTPNRCAENGYWKALTTKDDVKCVREGSVIGMKQSFAFHNGKPKDGIKTIWSMHEFTVNIKHLRTTTTTTTTTIPLAYHNHNDDEIVDEWVLCRVYKNGRKVKENAKQLHHHTSKALAMEEEVNTQIHQTNYDTNVNIPAASQGAGQFYYNGVDISASRFIPSPYLDQTIDTNVIFNPAASQGAAEQFYNGLILNNPSPYPDQTIDTNVIFNPAAGAAEQFYNGSNSSVSASMMMGEDNLVTLINPHDYPPFLDQTVFNNNANPAAAGAEQFCNVGYFSSLMMMGEDFINLQDYPPYLDQTVNYNNVNSAAPPVAAEQFYNIGSNVSESMTTGEDDQTVDFPAPEAGAQHFYNGSGTMMN